MLSFSHTVFLEVAKHLSFSKAAKALYTSQPSVSRHVNLLEKQYNCALFNRIGNSVSLTEVGSKIYSYLNEAIDIQKKIDYEVSILKNEHDAVGKLKIGASTTVSLYIIPKIISDFHQEYPHIEISVVNRNTENILNALIDKTIDVGIVEVESKLNSIDYTYFTSDKVIAVCAFCSDLASEKTISQFQLLHLPIALREQGSGTLSALTRELSKNGLSIADLNAKVRLGGTEALKNFILEDHSIGFLPQKAVQNALNQQILKELLIEGLEIKRDFFFLTRKGENFSLIKQFIRFANAAMGN